VRIHDVWRGLPDEERRLAAEELAALRSDAPWPGGAQTALTRALNFRPKRLVSMSDADFAELLVRHLGRLPPRHLTSLLVHLHVHGRVELLTAVYDAFGVEHDDGHLTDERLAEPLDEDQVLAGAETLLSTRSQDVRRLGFLLNVMSCETSSIWQPVVEKVRDRVLAACQEQAGDGDSGDGDSRVADEGVGIQVDVEAEADEADGSDPAERDAAEAAEDQSADGPTPAPAPAGPDATTSPPTRRPMGFTHLDRVLIDTAVASVTGTEGALDSDQLDGLVQEVLSLNAKRKVSWFHRGFVDALQQEELAERTSGGNAASRAWYLTGYVQGRMREDGSPKAVRELVGSVLSEADRETLLGHSGRAAGSMLAGSIVLPLLRAGASDEAQPWLDAYLPVIALGALRPILAWAKEGLVYADPEPVRRVLETVRRLRPKIEQIHGPLSHEMDHDLRRRMAVCWRRAGRFPEARDAVEALLTEEVTPYERSRLLGDRALIAMGVKAIEGLGLPRADGREAFLKSIAQQREVLERAVAAHEAVPSALVTLALPIVADAKAPDDERRLAEEYLKRALTAMNDEAPVFWRRTGLLRRCRFYLTLLELREADQAVISPAVSTLQQMLEEGDDLADDLPRDLVEEAVSLAVLAEARSSPAVAMLALKRRPHDMIRVLDLRQLAKMGRESRKAVIDALGAAADRLAVKERWKAWTDLLRGSLEGGDRGLGAAELALDALEGLAEHHGRAREFLELLDDENAWSPAWEHEDAFDAKIRLLLNLGRTEEATAALHDLAHRHMTTGEETAIDLIERLEELGAEPTLVDALRCRLDDLKPTPEPVTTKEPVSVSILFVGGNETQQGYEQALQEWFTGAYPGSGLEFRFPGWSSNWGRTTDELERRLEGGDAMVLMRFVRTGLGRAMRRAASDQSKPWIACSGHGRDAMRRAIEAAVDKARRLKLQEA
jgi:hypothetical protein